MRPLLAAALLALPCAGQLVFEPPRALDGVPAAGARVFVGRVDADGTLDLVLAATDPGGPIVWRAGRGGGAFLPPAAIEPGVDGAVLEVAEDLDGDARVDLVLAVPGGAGRASVLVRLGDGAGGFGEPVPVNAQDAAAPVEVVAAQVDGDPHLDLAIADAGDATHAPVLVVALALGGGAFATAAPVDAIAPAALIQLRAGDMTADGLDDLLLVADGEGQQYLATGTGELVPSPNAAPLGLVEDLLVVDLDGNARDDVVTADGRVYQSQASGLLTLEQDLRLDDGRALAVRDLDLDAEPDLVVARADGSLATFSGTVGGVVMADSNAVSGVTGAAHLAFGDFDEDGRPDLVATRGDEPGAWALRGRTYLPGEPFEDLGNALEGTGGFPVMLAEGAFGAGDAFALELAGARADAPAVLVAGGTLLGAPLLGGVLVPAPDLMVPLVTNGDGAAALAGVVREAPADLSAFAQWWIADPAASQGWAASSAVAISAGP